MQLFKQLFLPKEYFSKQKAWNLRFEKHSVDIFQLILCTQLKYDKKLFFPNFG